MQDWGHLFAALELSLSSGTVLNYSEEPTNRATAIGRFLARVPESCLDLHSKIKQDWEYKRMQLSQDLTDYTAVIRDEQVLFESKVRTWLTQVRLEGELLKRNSQERSLHCLTHVRNWLLTSITELEKQRRIVEAYLAMSLDNNRQRCEEMLDEYLYQRFLSCLRAVVGRRACITEVGSASKADLKRSLEDHFSCKFLVKHVIALEDLNYHDLTSDKQMNFTATRERTTVISAIYTETHMVEKLLTRFLTLQEGARAGPQAGAELVSRRTATVLSRSCKA
jgi:hypothetical protein